MKFGGCGVAGKPVILSRFFIFYTFACRNCAVVCGKICRHKRKKNYLDVSLHKVLFFSFRSRLLASPSLARFLGALAFHVVNILLCP